MDTDDEGPRACQRCGGADDDGLRTLWMSCFYDMDELGLPFEPRTLEGRTHFVLRVCKQCRSQWLHALRDWFTWAHTREIPLTRGKTARVDEEDFERVNQWSWRLHSEGYAFREEWQGDKRRCIYMHRFVLDAPLGSEVDHRNGNRLDNRRQNLRLVTHVQNMRNGRGHRDAAVKYKGVYWHQGRHKYAAQIHLDGKTRHLGLFRTAEEAALAYNDAARSFFGASAYLNDVVLAQEADIPIRDLGATRLVTQEEYERLYPGRRPYRMSDLERVLEEGGA